MQDDDGTTCAPKLTNCTRRTLCVTRVGTHAAPASKLGSRARRSSKPACAEAHETRASNRCVEAAESCASKLVGRVRSSLRNARAEAPQSIAHRRGTSPPRARRTSTFAGAEALTSHAPTRGNCTHKILASRLRRRLGVAQALGVHTRRGWGRRRVEAQEPSAPQLSNGPRARRASVGARVDA